MYRAIPPLNPMRAFEAAARHRSYTLAAAEMHVSQVAVSRQVKVLEDYLEVRLFDRTHRRLVLTAEGQQLFVTVARALNDIAHTTSLISLRWRKDVLLIQAYTTFAQRWLIPKIARFQKRHPNIELRLSASTQPVNFDQQNVDGAIRAGNGEWPGMAADHLVALDLLPVASPALLAEGLPLKTPDDLRQHTLLHSLSRPGDWDMWLAAAGASDVMDRQRSMKFENSVMAYEAALRGVGVAIAVRALVEQDLASGALVAPLAATHRIADGYYLVRPQTRSPSKAFEAFRLWLLEESEMQGGDAPPASDPQALS
jgi:LysR family glycine cleavage system transcriptional activator